MEKDDRRKCIHGRLLKGEKVEFHLDGNNYFTKPGVAQTAASSKNTRLHLTVAVRMWLSELADCSFWDEMLVVESLQKRCLLQVMHDQSKSMANIWNWSRSSFLRSSD